MTCLPSRSQRAERERMCPRGSQIDRGGIPKIGARVSCRNELDANTNCFKSHAVGENVDPKIASIEGVIRRRQHGLVVAAAEVHCPRVSRGNVAVGVECCDGHRERSAGFRAQVRLSSTSVLLPLSN